MLWIVPRRISRFLFFVLLLLLRPPTNSNPYRLITPVALARRVRYHVRCCRVQRDAMRCDALRTDACAASHSHTPQSFFFDSRCRYPTDIQKNGPDQTRPAVCVCGFDAPTKSLASHRIRWSLASHSLQSKPSFDEWCIGFIHRTYINRLRCTAFCIWLCRSMLGVADVNRGESDSDSA